jgi:hypothetical protein
MNYTESGSKVPKEMFCEDGISFWNMLSSEKYYTTSG